MNRLIYNRVTLVVVLGRKEKGRMSRDKMKRTAPE